MFQIGLTFALSVVVCVATWLWTSRLRRGSVAPKEARRVLVALERAGHTALRRRLARLPLPIGATVVLVLMAQYFLPAQKPSALTLIQFIVPPLLVVLGAAATALLTWHCLRDLHRNAYSVWSGATVSNERTLSSAWTSATSLLIAAEVAGMLCVFGLYQLVEWLVRGVGATASGPSPIAATAPYTSAHWTAYFGIGATVAAVWLQHMGSICLGAANLGVKSTFRRSTGLDHTDARNPAVLIGTIARQLGEFLPRVLDSFVASTLVSTLTLLLLQRPSGSGPFEFATPVATLPLLLRGFGVLATLFGLMTLRATEHERLERSIFRSQLVAELVFVGATIGGILWLVGTWSPALAVAALAGVILPSLLARLRAIELTRPERERSGNAVPTSDEQWQKLERLGVLLGRVVLLPAGVYALAFLLSLLGLTSLEPQLALAALIIALGTPSALSSWRGAASLASDIQATALLSGRLGRLPLPQDAQLRHQRLAEVLARLATLSDPVRVDGGALLCALAAVVIGWTAPRPPTLLVPALVAIALFALLPSLLALASGVQRGARCGQAQYAEISRQMRGLRKEGSTVLVPVDFVPSYRSCVELLARDAAKGGLVAVALAVALPLLVVLVGAGTENSPGPRATLLAMYLSVAVAAGLVIVHVGQAGALASSLARRNQLNRAPVEAESESDPFELVGFVQRTVAVSIPLLIKATTLVALAFAAILT